MTSRPQKSKLRKSKIETIRLVKIAVAKMPMPIFSHYYLPMLSRYFLLLGVLGTLTDSQDGPEEATAGYVGADTYREGYSGGNIAANLVLWVLPAPKTYQHYEEPYPYIEEQVTIVESSRYKYPTKADPEQSTAINLAHFLIDADIKTKWWSAIDELQSWIEIDLGNPAHRIRDEDSQQFFLWKYQDQIDAGKEIDYLDGGLIGFHVDAVIIRWSEMFASADYKIQSSIDKIQWKDRAVQLEMPNVYDRVDVIPGWSVQGVGNTRYLRLTMVGRVFAKNAWGMREGPAWEKAEKERKAKEKANAAAAEAEAAGEGDGGRRRFLDTWSVSASAWWTWLWDNGGIRGDAHHGDDFDRFEDPSIFYGGRQLSDGFITKEEQYDIGKTRDAGTGTERTVYGIREIEIIGPEPSMGAMTSMVSQCCWIVMSLMLVYLVC